MKINAIKLNYSTPVFGANNKPENNNSAKSEISGKKIALGLAGLAAVGIATFAILRGKKPSKKVINETVSNAEEAVTAAAKAADDLINPAEKLPLEIKPADILIDIKTPANPKKTFAKTEEIIEEAVIIPEEKIQTKIEPASAQKAVVTETSVKPFSLAGKDEAEHFEGVEKLIYTDNKDGTGRTYQRFYNKDRLYEYNIFDEILGETPSTKNVTRYNLAYENGRLAGVAKQDIYKDGLQHGEYKDNGFNPFPILIKMKGEKDFHEANVYTSDALYELDKRFSPFNL